MPYYHLKFYKSFHLGHHHKQYKFASTNLLICTMFLTHKCSPFVKTLLKKSMQMIIKNQNQPNPVKKANKAAKHSRAKRRQSRNGFFTQISNAEDPKLTGVTLLIKFLHVCKRKNKTALNNRI